MDVRREAAIKAGEVLYTPVRKCKRGHQQRYTSSGICKECQAIYDSAEPRRAARAAYDKANVESVKERAKRYERSARGRARKLLANAKDRALRVGVPFDLCLDDISIPEFCPVLGVRLSHGIKKPTANSPSLDRMTPHLGYVKGNVFVISHRANSIKNDATANELRKVADWVESHQAEKTWT